MTGPRRGRDGQAGYYHLEGLPAGRYSVIVVTAFPDGRFEFANVPPGDYTIQAFRTRSNPSTEGEFAGAYVQVSGADVTGVELKATVGSTVKGN